MDHVDDADHISGGRRGCTFRPARSAHATRWGVRRGRSADDQRRSTSPDEPLSHRDGEVAVATHTFLFTDVEGSTRLLQAVGARYTDLLSVHRRVVREAIDRHGGLEHDAEGDAFFVVFPNPRAGLAAAVSIQRAMTHYPWPTDAVLRIRAGLHTGSATVVEGRYYGADVHKAARICAAAHGGQLVVSADTALLLSAHALPADVRLIDLGEHMLRDFDDPVRLYQVEVDDLPQEFPALRTPRVAAVRIPQRRTSFVGRHAELAQARELLSRVRLLTLTGPGGVGKTRLAVELASAVAREFPDGVTFVPLAPISDAGLVCNSIAQALDLSYDGRRPIDDVITAYLATKQALLILDNFEHLVSGAPVIGELLDAAPKLRVVVTSRTPLQLAGEQQLMVAPLPVPSPGSVTASTADRSSAVRLFAERAREVNPSFAVDDDNAGPIATACARLDGLPLAIELAAALTSVLPVSEIAGRLDQPLALLVAGPRDQPDRLRSLHAAVSWSYDLLTEPTRAVFQQLSVFVGGASLDVVQRVCAPPPGDNPAAATNDVLGPVSELVSHSLIRRVDDVVDARFTMLETIRQYASEALVNSGTREVVRNRHATAFLDLAEQAAPALLSHESHLLLERLELEQHNLRAAFTWFVDHDEAGPAMRMVVALWRYWQMRGHLAEAQERIDQVLRVARDRNGDPTLRLAMLEAIGGIAYWRGDVARAAATYREAVDVSRTIDDPDWAARSLSNLAYALRGMDRIDEALAAAHEALRRFTTQGNKAGAAGALRLIAILNSATGDLDSADAAAAEAKALFETLDRPFDLAWTLRQVGMLQLKRGHPAEARRVLSEALRLFNIAHDTSGAPVIMADLASVASAEGDTDSASKLMTDSRSMQMTTGAQWARIVDRLEHRANMPDDQEAE